MNDLRPVLRPRLRSVPAQGKRFKALPSLSLSVFKRSVRMGCSGVRRPGFRFLSAQ